MKTLSIADYFDHLGRPAGDKTPPRPEGSPFRPRSLPSPQNNGLGTKPNADRAAKAGSETQGEEPPRRTPWAPKPVLLESGARPSPGSAVTSLLATHRRTPISRRGRCKKKSKARSSSTR